MTIEVPYESAAATAAAVRRGAASPTEVVTAYLERADRLDPVLNAFAHRDDERVLADAAAATERLAASDSDDLPALFGVPVPIKDLTDVAGWPTTLGSRATDDTPAVADSPVTARIRAAGAILMGKTTTPEFGTVSYTESERLGVTRNPWNPDHTPGGSSGGAAAAVAAGMAPLAQASDGAGSIRLPASCCGLVGLKPARNRVTQRVELNSGGVVWGTVSRTVADAALGLDVLAIRDPRTANMAPPPEGPFLDEVGRDPGRLRIMVSADSPLGVPTAPGPAAALERTAVLLDSLGHDVSTGTPDWPDMASAMGAFLLVWGARQGYHDLPHPGKVEPHHRSAGSGPSADDYVRATVALQEASYDLVGQWGGEFDLLLTPTMAVEPPRVGEWLEDVPDDDPQRAVLNCLPMAAFSGMFNLSGQPAISLPVEIAESGLPVGVQLVGGPWQEALLLRLAAQLESECRWAERWPEMASR